jgi:bifunctional N-acetylglucosamine-1-phosphate-uridyltransferase/glucosamine-1-phosphate-acetyltransferase GlmU-like protein
MVKIIIPMSGMGERFVKEGYNDPKPLIDIDGKPMIYHVVKLFGDEKDLHFICNKTHIQTTNMKDVLNNYFPYAKIHIIDNHKLGPVHSVSQINIEDNDDDIIISYCDYGTEWNYNKFLEHSKNKDGCIVVYKGFHPHMLGKDHYAYLKTNNDKVEKISEKKPFTDDKMSEYASNGTYYFKNISQMKYYFNKLIEINERVNNEFYISMVYNLMINDGLNIGYFEIDKMLQWGTPYDLQIYKYWMNCFKSKINIKHKYNNITTIIPLAGKGSRFKDYNKPKPLLEIDNKPMIISATKCLPNVNDNTFIVLKDHQEKYNITKEIKNYYPESKVIIIDKVTEGQACTIEYGLNEVNGSILISACDNGIIYDEDKLDKLLNDETIDVIVFSYRNNPASKNNPNMYAWLDVDENDNIKKVYCKNFVFDDPIKSHAIVGTMFFRKIEYFTDGLQENYKNNYRVNNEFYVDDIINRNIEKDLNVKVFEVDYYMCWGTPDDYKTYLYWQEHFTN